MEIKANMAANVWKVNVNTGEEIEENQELVILESMKMEIPIEAEKSGTIIDIKIEEGDFVDEGDVLMIIE